MVSLFGGEVPVWATQDQSFLCERGSETVLQPAPLRARPARETWCDGWMARPSDLFSFLSGAVIRTEYDKKRTGVGPTPRVLYQKRRKRQCGVCLVALLSFQCNTRDAHPGGFRGGPETRPRVRNGGRVLRALETGWNVIKHGQGNSRIKTRRRPQRLDEGVVAVPSFLSLSVFFRSLL